MHTFSKFALILAFTNISVFAAQLDQSLNVIEKTNTKLNSLQRNINYSEDKRLDLLNEYKYVNQTLKSTQNYNTQLDKIIVSQDEELASLDQQIIDIETTQKNIFPLMKDMISSLKTLVNADTPFLMSERIQRVEKLENTLSRADIQTHEKYRIILEAFKIEYDYAKTIESYQDTIGDKTYNFFRLGRVALYTQSLDLKDYKYFNKESKTWDKITDSTAKSNIRKAIKIARKQENVALLNLPFLAKKETK